MSPTKVSPLSMVSRTYLISAIVLWCASTTWLVTTKILPAFTTGKPPQYADLLPAKAEVVPPVRWQIRWSGQSIGWAENRMLRRPDGTGRITSEVEFKELPVDRILKDLMGALGSFAQAIHGDIGPLSLRVFSELDFDHYGSLESFVTRVDVAGMENLLQLEGQMREDNLHLVARADPDGDRPHVVTRKEIPLPGDAFVADTFSPRPRFTDLQLGQKWTFQSYRPLAPHNPMELIEATVEREELIEWSGTMQKAKKIVYRRDAGSGVSSTRRPVSELWVDAEGNVLRQDLWLANIRVQFVRTPRATGPETPPSEAP